MKFAATSVWNYGTKSIMVFYYSAKRLYLEDFSYQASALSFITLLSIIPVLSVTLYLLSYFSLYFYYIQSAENYIYTNFLPDAAFAVKDYLHQFIYQASTLPFISILFSFITGILMLLTIEKAFNKIFYKAHNGVSVILKLASWTIALLIIFLVALLSFIFSSLIHFFLMNALQVALLQVSNFLINTVLLATLYVYIPNQKTLWRDGLLAGALSAFLFEMGRSVFGFYVQYLTNYQHIYGSLAVIPIFLLWVYVSWLIILFGGIFIYEKQKLFNPIQM